MAFAREHLPRVNGGLQSLEPQQRCYYVQLRSSEECEDRGDQDFPSAAPPSPASPATSVARR